MNAMTRMNDNHLLHAQFTGPIVMIGFGSIGRGVLPLLERHIGFDRSKFVVIDPVDTDRILLDERKIRFEKIAITRDNYRQVLTPLLTGGPGRGMIINLSVDTSSADLIDFCKDIDAFYIDTVVEPWPGLYTNRNRSISERSNYALREGLLDLRRRRPAAGADRPARAVERARLELAGEQPVPLVRSRQPQPAGLLAREAETSVVWCVADQHHGAVAKPLRVLERTLDQRAPDPAAAIVGVHCDRPEQQRWPRRAGGHVPEPRSANDAAAVGRDKRETLRRQTSFAQPFGRLLEARRTE